MVLNLHSNENVMVSKKFHKNFPFEKKIVGTFRLIRIHNSNIKVRNVEIFQYFIIENIII